MFRAWHFVVAAVLLKTVACSDGRLAVDKVFALSGSSFMNYVAFDEAVSITNCSMSYYYDFHYTDNAMINVTSIEKIKDDGPLEDRMFSLGQSRCGFKLVDLREIDPMSFRINVSFVSANRTVRHSEFKFTTEVSSKGNPTHQTINVTLGGDYELACGNHWHIDVDCRLYSPSGRLVKSGNFCRHSVLSARMEDIGIWRCENSLKDSMQAFVQHLDLKLQTSKQRSLQTWYKEENNFATLGCKSSDFPTQDEYCQLIAPNLKVLTVKPGAATNRYTTAGTNLTHSKCQIQFPLPIQPEEIGSWICKVNGLTGFILANTTELPSYPKSKDLDIVLGKPFTLSCQMPYSVQHCHIKSPNETYFIEDPEELQQGNCSKTFEARPRHIGEWSCHVSHPLKTTNEVIRVNVREEIPFYAVRKMIAVHELEPFEVMCRHKEALKACEFLDPQGNTYHLNDSNISGNVTYSGRGLRYGDCGLRVQTSTWASSGLWTCSARKVTAAETEVDSDSVNVHIDG